MYNIFLCIFWYYYKIEPQVPEPGLLSTTICFADTNHFLIETVEGYSMSGEDDKEKDTLLEKITQLQAKISSIFGITGKYKYVYNMRWQC